MLPSDATSSTTDDEGWRKPHPYTDGHVSWKTSNAKASRIAMSFILLSSLGYLDELFTDVSVAVKGNSLLELLVLLGVE